MLQPLAHSTVSNSPDICGTHRGAYEEVHFLGVQLVLQNVTDG